MKKAKNSFYSGVKLTRTEADCIVVKLNLHLIQKD